MKVSEVMRKKVVYVNAETNIEKTMKLMHQKNIRCCVVCDEKERVVGIVTDSDIVLKGALKKNFEKMAVKEIMTKNPVTTSPDTSILEVIQIMRQKKFRRMPVVENDKLVGIVSITDIAPYIVVYMQRALGK